MCRQQYEARRHLLQAKIRQADHELQVARQASCDLVAQHQEQALCEMDLENTRRSRAASLAEAREAARLEAEASALSYWHRDRDI